MKKALLGAGAVVGSALIAGFAVRRRNQWRREHPIEWRKEQLEIWANKEVELMKKQLDLTGEQVESMKSQIIEQYEIMRDSKNKLVKAEAHEIEKMKLRLRKDAIELKERLIDLLSPHQRIKLSSFGGFRIDLMRDHPHFGVRQIKR